MEALLRCFQIHALAVLAMFLAVVVYPARAAAVPECPDNMFEKDAPHNCHSGWRPYISIGPALSALSVNLDSKRIGLLDKAAAIEVHGSFGQRLRRTSFHGADGKNEIVRISWWEWGVGFQVQKPQDSSDIALGFYIVPYGIRINSFAMGVGMLYNTVGGMSWGLENFSIIVPLTYQIDAG